MRVVLSGVLSLLVLCSNANPMNHHQHGGHGFEPLPCNHMIDSAPCAPFSSQSYDVSQPVVIPCGSCITMDLAGNQTFSGGLDVRGKLVFPSTRSSLEISTPYVFVQGEFIVEELEDNILLPQPEHDLEFRFVGTDDVHFMKHSQQPFDKCGEDTGGCNLSKKPFVVAGGRVDISGMSEHCDTWTRVQSTGDAGAASITPLEAPSAIDGCSRVLVSETFDNSNDGVDSLSLRWDGDGAGSATVEDGYFSVSSRTSSTQGPRVYLPFACISPNEEYVIKFRYRYRHSSSDKSDFVKPYLKMIRYKAEGGADWIGVDELHGRGSHTARVPVDEWQQLEAVIRFDESIIDTSTTSDLSLYIAPFDDADVIDIDDFVLELAPAFAFEDRSCDSLLLNGNADGGNPFAYPFYSKGGSINVITDDGEAPYFRNTLRSSVYSSPISQNVPPECLVKAAIYEFSANVRVHSSEARNVVVTLSTDDTGHTIVQCPPSAGEWVQCSGRIRLDSEHEGASSAFLSTSVSGDDSSDVDMNNIQLEYRGGRANVITPENLAGISDCWGPGAEVLVTSHTTQYIDSQVATIASIAENGDIVLQDAIHKPISIEDDAQTAVEIALLTRNIRFVAVEDDAENPLHGGHLIIMHTPAPTMQRLVGIESHGFGQQGKLGRYPFHFHMCGSVAGSILSKNSVRNTKQRGVVVHGSNDLYLEGNILHNTRGHGFMLEDGAETGNTFIHNLGAVGHPVDVRISDAESDTNPATYWITNPQNKWIGNVAAGSSHSGFWFEVSGRVRGPSFHGHQDMVPNKLDLLKFIDNVSHGSSQGLQTYPQSGYRPETLAVFENHKSYRNRRAGVFFHAGGRLSIDGWYLSDNPIGVDIDMDHSDVISNSIIVGSSPAYETVVDNMGFKGTQWPERRLCSKSLVGVRLDSFHDGSLWGATGTSIVNTSFSGFGSCEGSSALHVNKEDSQYFDTRNRLESVSILDDSPRINLCDGEKQVAIRVQDVSFMDGVAGFLISDTNAINAHPDCESIGPESCAAFCPNTCLRTMTVMIPSGLTYERGSLTLRVTGTLADGRSITPIEVQDFQDKEMYLPQKESSHGRFFVTLPESGIYYAQFVDSQSGESVWPLYADLRYEDGVDNCGPDFESFVVETLAPDQCEQLIQNGDFELGTSEKWRYAGHYGLEVVDNGSTYSLKAPNSEGGAWVGPGQYLDTRCIEEGYIYSITADVKLTDSSTGELFECNLESYHSCPKASFRFTNRLEDNIHDWEVFGRLETNDQEWNTLSGSYVASDYAGSANKVYMYITGVQKGIDIEIDNVQLTRSEATPEPTSNPTSSPTKNPTSSPTAAPSNPPSIKSEDEEEDGGDEASALSLFEGSSATSVTIDGGNIRLETSSQEPSTALSKMAHQGDLELMVHVSDRDFLASGWQPSLVLFFAPGDTPIEDVTTPDNGYHNFRGSIVAYMNHRMYPALGSYFRSYAKQETDEDDFSMSSKYASTLPLPTSGTALKLTRSTGVLHSFFSLDDGATWTEIGSGHLLAPEYRNAPLKVGYRMYMEYKTSYRLETIPSIVSGGEVTVTTSPAALSYFDGSNADLDSMTCNASDGCLVEGYRNVAKLLSHDVFEGDVVFVSEFIDRPLFGNGYQSGLWLFMVPSDATLDSIPSSDGAFRDYAIGTVGDKIYKTIDHTWIYSSSIDSNDSSKDQYLGQSWKNLKGYTKLQRVDGKISAFVSPNGNTWTRVGGEIELPEALKNAPVKLGYRVAKNWAPGYEFQVLSTVE